MYKIFLKLFSWEHDASITNKEKKLFPKKYFIEIYPVRYLQTKKSHLSGQDFYLVLSQHSVVDPQK